MKKPHVYIVLFIGLFVLIQPNAFSQDNERKGVHQLQKEEFGNLESRNIRSFHNEKIEPLSKRVKALNKTVFGFLPYWEQSNGANATIQYNLISHLACFDFLVQLDASITPPAGWPWTTEINAAHAAGTKVIMTVVNFGGSNSADAVAWELFTNSAKRDIFFLNVKNTIQNYSLDGVNIDFEGMISTHRGVELNTFMLQLTSYIHTELPGKEVSFDGPAVNWGGWLLNDLVASIDYLIIMAYDYTGANDGFSGPIAPLIHPTSNWKSITKTLQNSYAAPVSNAPQKLILAVPYYGRHWKTNTGNSESSTISYVGSTRYKNTVIEANSHGGFIWNSSFEYPWYKWHDGTNWNQVWTDNEQSLEMKFDMALSENLGGIGIWALNYDGSRPELWNLISTKFSNTSAIDENEMKSLQMYPNPAKKVLTIFNPKKRSLKSVFIFNSQGKIIVNNTINNKISTILKIDISDLNSGFYFVKFKTKNSSFTKKLIVE